MSESPKKLHIKTYGCQMNVYDSERMAEAMGAKGYELTDDPAEADMVLLNTCHIREKAAEKVYSDLGRLRPFKEARPDLKIGVAGCVAQAEGAEIMRRMPLVDLVVGSQNYHRLPEMVAAAEQGARPVDTEFPLEDKFDHLPERPLAARPTAFLTVQEGCDKFCAFCVVPYTRGAEVSRPAARILEHDPVVGPCLRRAVAAWPTPLAADALFAPAGRRIEPGGAGGHLCRRRHSDGQGRPAAQGAVWRLRKIHPARGALHGGVRDRQFAAWTRSDPAHHRYSERQTHAPAAESGRLLLPADAQRCPAPPPPVKAR